MYEPKRAVLVILRSRLTDAWWAKRVADARAAERALQAVDREMVAGLSMNRAIAKVLPPGKRSWATRRMPRYRELGFEGLFDERLPREPWASRQIREIIGAAVEKDRRIDLEGVVALLQERDIDPLPSPATIRRELANAGARVRRKQQKEPAAAEIIELPFAGGELMLAAELETGAMAALTTEVSAIATEALEASRGREPERDTEHRDAGGRFTRTYNRRRRRKRGEEIASYLRSAEEKAAGRVPSWARFVHEREQTLEAKMRMLVFEPVVSRTNGWAGLRSPEAAGLSTLTGFAYMPSTLSKFTSALAIANAGPRLLEAAGKCWHEVGARRGERGAMAALYVDNHAKEVWTNLFTQAAKVSSLSRVMPAITTTYVHTGAGTPLVMGIQSGAAPLAPQLPSLVRRAEAVLGDGIRRAVVIDAEGSTFDVLHAFAKDRRIIVTPLRPSRTPELEIAYSPGSYYRPYRENDELRVATATLRHRSTGRSLELGVLLLRRGGRDSDTVLLTTGLALGMEGRDLADLYFARWPLQENWFKEATALGLDRHRGNCSQMVANVAVVTEIERLERRLARLESRRVEMEEASRSLEESAGQAYAESRRAQRSLATSRAHLDGLAAGDRTHTKAFANEAAEHHRRLVQAEAAVERLQKAQAAVERHRAGLARIESDREKARARIVKAAPMRRIRKLDVALDSILTATKLTAMQLMTYVSREYLPELGLTTPTFIARVFPLRGRRERSAKVEKIVFYANERDPEITAALRDACRRLDKRALTRDGRRLRYAVEDPAAPNAGALK